MATNELLKGMLKPLVLKLLIEKGRLYGYEITQLVKEISSGEISLTFGALYPILHKLEKDGLIKAESEVVGNRNRIYYSIPQKQSKKAMEKVGELQEVLKTLGIFFKPNLGLRYEQVKC